MQARLKQHPEILKMALKTSILGPQNIGWGEAQPPPLDLHLCCNFQFRINRGSSAMTVGPPLVSYNSYK